MCTPELTIIIPVYNTANYLNRCLEAITNQAEQNIEIIIVNDGSTDNSDFIIHHFAKAHTNIHCINKEVRIGVGDSRNIGIRNAKTPYIGFVDSDDWVDITYYQALLKSIISTNADVCISGIKTESDDVYNWKYRYEYPTSTSFDGHFCLQSLTRCYNTDFSISPIVNNRIYKTSLLTDNDIFFDDTRRAQDVYFSFMVFIYADKVSINENVFYHYYQRDLSATHDFSVSYVDDYSHVLLTLKEELNCRNLFKKYEEEYYRYVYLNLTKLINNMFNNIQRSNEQKELIIYILKSFSTIMPFDRTIKYIDVERLKDFWRL